MARGCGAGAPRSGHARPAGAREASGMRWEWQTKAMEGRRSAPGQATPPVDRAWPVGRPRQRGGRGGREGTPPHSFTVTVAPRVLLELRLLRSPPLPTFLTTLRFCAGFRVLGEGKGSLSRENVPVSRGPARASSSLDAHGEPAAGGAAAGAPCRRRLPRPSSVFLAEAQTTPGA